MIDVYKKHKNKKVYKISAIKTLKLDQYVVAENEDEAFDKWLENGGIKHDMINTDLTNTDTDVDTDYIDVSTGDHTSEYIGTVTSDPDSEEEDDLIVNTNVKEEKWYTI